jgi:hypothetical protein
MNGELFGMLKEVDSPVKVRTATTPARDRASISQPLVTVGGRFPKLP